MNHTPQTLARHMLTEPLAPNLVRTRAKLRQFKRNGTFDTRAALRLIAGNVRDAIRDTRTTMPEASERQTVARIVLNGIMSNAARRGATE